MIFKFIICILALTSFVFISTSACAQTLPENNKNEPAAEKQKTAWSAQITRRQNETNKINGLEFSQMNIPVFLVNSQNRFRPYVEIEILYPASNKELFVGKKKLLRSVDGKYKLSFYLTSKVNQFSLEARPISKSLPEEKALNTSRPEAQTNHSEIEKEVIFVQSPDAQEYRQTDPLNILRVAIGANLLNYFQTGYGDYAAWMAWIGLSYLSPVYVYNLGWQAELEGTLFAVKSNQSNIAPQVYHGTLQAYYKFNHASDTDLEYFSFFGADYLTMQSNGAAFGIKDLISPRFGFVARKIISEKEDWFLKLGLTPADQKLENAGFDLDVSKSWLQDNLRRLEVGIKYQQYKMNDSALTNVRVIMSTLYLSYTL